MTIDDYHEAAEHRVQVSEIAVINVQKEFAALLRLRRLPVRKGSAFPSRCTSKGRRLRLRVRHSLVKFTSSSSGKAQPYRTAKRQRRDV